ncbi:MAG: DUF2752 domain-containing protein [Spirochaetales bacterium]|nr:DUF2752 domain-containing protein [Spirochaetales bacterium]
MTFGFEKTTRFPRIPVIPFVLAGIWVFLVVLAILFQEFWGQTVELCFFKRVTGIPCPSCGTGTSVIHLYHGNIPEAFFSNPFMFTGLVLLSLYLVFRLVFARHPVISLKNTERFIFWGSMAFAFLLNWLYLIFIRYSAG